MNLVKSKRREGCIITSEEVGSISSSPPSLKMAGDVGRMRDDDIPGPSRMGWESAEARGQEPHRPRFAHGLRL